MGKRKADALCLTTKNWAALAGGEGGAALRSLLEQKRANDILKALSSGLQPGGALHGAPTSLRLAVLAMLEAHAVELCGEAPQDVLRLVFESVRDRATNAVVDGAEGATRVQLAALRANTTLLVKLEMQQRDARLMKVHVESLFRIMERSVPHAGAPPELCHAAATCLRRMEEAAPTLLLAGAKQLLDLARQETSGAAEAYAMLAARVLAHGAERCLDQSSSQSDEDSGRGEAAAAASPGGKQTAAAGGGAEEDTLSLLSSIDVRALSLGMGAGCCELSGVRSEPGAGRPVAFVSPVGTLDAAAAGMGATFASSGRTGRSSEGDLSSPKDGPGSPRGVASALGTASTLDGSSLQHMGGAAAAALATAVSFASSDISGSVSLDGSAHQALLAPGGPGLRHYRVPQHLHWPDALGNAALSVYVTPEALADVRQACVEYLAAMPRLSVEGVACLTAALPPILRLAELPPAELQEALDALLHSGRTLMLQAVLKLYPSIPDDGFCQWRRRLLDTVLAMVNGPHPAEHRTISITWALLQHHTQMHARQPSLFAGAWRQLMPRSDDPPQLLSLKVKALSACLAVGIGRADVIIPMVFAWDGFWQMRPTDQQLRLATYALRMLASAGISYAHASPAAVEAARRCTAAGGLAIRPSATRPPAAPHHVKTCVVSACLQLVATRPQYLPAVEAFLTHSATACPDLQLALLNALDSLFSAAATGTFSSLAPPRRQGQPIGRPRSRPGAGAWGGGPASSPDDDASGSSADGGGKGLSGMMARLKLGVSKRLGSTSSSPSNTPSPDTGGALAAAAEGAPVGPGGLPSIPEGALNMAAPEPKTQLASWEAAEAWLWDSRTWAGLSANVLVHDPMRLRALLLRLAQSGTAVLPMGALRLLAAYASQYQGEQAGHELGAKEAGNSVLAICQAAAMTHLLIGPRGTAAGGGARGRAAACEEARDGSVRSGASRASSSGGDGSSYGGGGSAQWTLQQEEIAAAMQAVLSALTSHFPVDSVQRRAQSFLDLLSNPAAWDLRVRMGTMAKMLGGYFSDAISAVPF